jgi:hypothetical protein
MCTLPEPMHASKHLAQVCYALRVPSSGDEPATLDPESDVLSNAPRASQVYQLRRSLTMILQYFIIKFSLEQFYQEIDQIHLQKYLK